MKVKNNKYIGLTFDYGSRYNKCLNLIFYYLLSNNGSMSPYKKMLIIIDIVVLIVSMLVLAGLIFLAISLQCLF